MSKKQLWSFIKDSAEHWSSHRASRMGAALSYYTIFSIVPLLSLIVVIAGYSLGHAYIATELSREIGTLIGKESGDFIDSLLSSSIEGSTGLTVSIASIIALAIGTLGMLRELKNSMDDLWETPVKKRELHWFRTYISSRLVSLSVIPVFAVLLIVSLVFSTLLAFAGPSAEIWLKIGNMAFLALVTTSLFAFIFRYMPGRKIPWKEVLSGAFATAILFILGKSIIGLYLAHFAGTSAFGTAGAFVLILLWIYYSVQIFFFGASMTYVWSRNYGYLKTHK